MIGKIDIKINAENPNFPLRIFRAFVNSPSSVRVCNVPRKIGSWNIERIFVSVTYPDNQIRSKECVNVDGIWVATIPASPVVGTSLNGYTVTANGTDENGNAVEGYILGNGNVEILSTDGTITPGETTYYVHLLTAAPETPHKGDAYVDAGVWKIFNGAQWVVLGGVSAAGQYVQAPSAQGGDGKWHKVIIVDGALTIDTEGVDEPPEAATRLWVSQQINAESAARDEAITAAVNEEADARTDGDAANAALIAAEAEARAAAIEAEVTARNAAIAVETAARAQAVSAEANARVVADEAEATARASGDSALGERIDAEASSRVSADTALGGRIDTESSTRAAADTALSGRIDAEATARATGDAANAAAVTAIQTQMAGTAASGLREIIAQESSRAEGAESELNDAIVAEIARATAAEQTNADAITAETERAEAAEQTNADAITAETERAEAAEQTNADAISAETERATAAEQTNADAISAETERATAAEQTNAAAITAETERATAAEETKVPTDGDHTVNGVKTFSQSPLVPIPTADGHAANKKFVEDFIEDYNRPVVERTLYVGNVQVKPVVNRTLRLVVRA